MNNLIRTVSWKCENASQEAIEQEIKFYAHNCKSYYTNIMFSKGNVYFTLYSKISYKELTKQLIRQKYDEDDEYKLHREAFISGITEEFTIYNNYVEQCKAQAKEWIDQRNKALGV